MNPIRRRQMGVNKPGYQLYDAFLDTLAAGAINGTLATPPRTVKAVVATRTVTDTESKLSISGGVLTFAGGKAAYGDPTIWYPAITRVAGRTLIFQLVYASGTCSVGCDTTGSGAIDQFNFVASATSLQTISVATGAAVYSALSVGVSYQLASVMRSVGVYFLIKGGSLASWTLLWISGIGNNSPLVPGTQSYSAAFTADNIRIPDRLYIPTPLAYDTFTRADDSLGSSEAVGPDGQSVPQLAWTGSTWAISSGKAVNTPTVGAELWTNGGFETAGAGGADVFGTWAENVSGTSTVNDETSVIKSGGHACRLDVDAANSIVDVSQQVTAALSSWLAISGWLRASGAGKKLGFVASSPAVNFVERDPGATWTRYVDVWRVTQANPVLVCRRRNGAESGNLYFDDVSVKALTLATLFATQAHTTTNILIDIALSAYTTGTQAGLVLRLDSAASPANFILAYQDSGNVKIDECVAGVYTNLGTYASAYASGDSLRVSLDGNAWRLYKITAAGAATLLGSGTTAVTTGTLHGLFSTDASNTLDGWQCWARGNEGQYEGLSAL